MHCTLHARGMQACTYNYNARMQEGHACALHCTLRAPRWEDVDTPRGRTVAHGKVELSRISAGKLDQRGLQLILKVQQAGHAVGAELRGSVL